MAECWPGFRPQAARSLGCPACWEELAAGLAAAGLILAFGGVLRGIALRLAARRLWPFDLGRCWFLPSPLPLPGSLCGESVWSAANAPFAGLVAGGVAAVLVRGGAAFVGGGLRTRGSLAVLLVLLVSATTAAPPPLRSPGESLLDSESSRYCRATGDRWACRPSCWSRQFSWLRAHYRSAGREHGRCPAGYCPSWQDPSVPALIAVRGAALITGGTFSRQAFCHLRRRRFDRRGLFGLVAATGSPPPSFFCSCLAVEPPPPGELPLSLLGLFSLGFFPPGGALAVGTIVAGRLVQVGLRSLGYLLLITGAFGAGLRLPGVLRAATLGRRTLVRLTAGLRFIGLRIASGGWVLRPFRRWAAVCRSSAE